MRNSIPGFRWLQLFRKKGKKNLYKYYFMGDFWSIFSYQKKIFSLVLMEIFLVYHQLRYLCHHLWRLQHKRFYKILNSILHFNFSKFMNLSSTLANTKEKLNQVFELQKHVLHSPSKVEALYCVFAINLVGYPIYRTNIIGSRINTNTIRFLY